MNILSFIEGVGIEEVLQELINNLHEEGPINTQDFEKLSYIKKFHPELFLKYEGKLMHIIVHIPLKADTHSGNYRTLFSKKNRV